MHNLKAILAALSITLLPSCLIQDFDDIETGAYVHSDGKGGAEVAGFGSALIATGGTEGLNYYVVATTAPTVIHVNFDEEGERTTFDPEVLPSSFPGLQTVRATPTVASDTSSFSTPGLSTVVIGIVENGDAKIVRLNATFDLDATSPTLRHRGQPITLQGGQEPTGIAFGNSNALAAATDTVDLMAISGGQLNLVADYQGEGAAAVNCSLQMGGGELLLADLDPTAGDEVVIADENRVFVETGEVLRQRMVADPAVNCGLGIETGVEVAAPAGATSFGHALAFGDFGGTALPDLVVADPENNAVYVYIDWTMQSPTAAQKIATPADSVAFGTTIAVGDFDNDGQDELVVGDPKKEIGAHPEAGTAYIYSGDGAGGFKPALYLHDARAEDNQNFGRSLAVVSAFGRDRLVVGAKDEVFTYFKTPLSGDVDFRP